MAKHYPSYEDLCQQRQSGQITDVEFVRQISDEVTEEYEDFCKNEGLDPERNESALAFLDFKEDLFEESISN
mgnify:CR=1 FL=1